ncbi:MAG: hypothetical protein HQL99_07155 [Magnetococcales bacterium]|nr:hypothetical protein [Magnetococcales bacterium]
MNSSSWNHLGARYAPYLVAACMGLELSRVTWLALPDPVSAGEPVQLQPEKGGGGATQRALSGATVLDGLKAFNPWENVAVEKEKPVPRPVEVKEVAVDSNLELNLIGAMILPQLSWAILTRKKDPNTQIVLQIGEEVDGAFLKRIERNAVYFDNRGRMERIAMQDRLKSDSAGLGGAQSVAGATAGAAVATVQTIPRQEYDAMLNKGMGLLAGVNITPFYQGKDSVGYRVKFPDSRTEFTKMGLMPDDVIQQVNGISVIDAQKIGQLTNQLKGISTLRIDVLRDNQPKSIELAIGN